MLLRIAAFFELFDGFQVVATGALRGLGDTRIAHAGAPGRLLGWSACRWRTCCVSRCGWGAPGIWVGLSAALILIGGTLLAVWRRRQKDQSTLV